MADTESRDRLDATITFKSGAQITLHVRSISAVRNGFGDLTEMEWEAPYEDAMQWINVSEIAAITTHRTVTD